MKIAVTFENGNVFDHFGHSEQFKIYDIIGGEIASSAVVTPDVSGHSALAEYLKENKVTALICGGIGGGAISALAEARILVFAGVSGDADEAVNALLSGKLSYKTIPTCNHHDHSCGDHDCSTDGCGCGCGCH